MSKVCRVCGSKYEYIKSLDRYGYSKCIKDILLEPFLMTKMLDNINKEVEWDKKN